MRYARRLRRPKAIDWLKTAEVRAFMRPTARCVTERSETGPTAEGEIRQFVSRSRNAVIPSSPHAALSRMSDGETGSPL